MDWNTESKVSQFDVNAPIAGMTDARSSQRTGSNGSFIGNIVNGPIGRRVGDALGNPLGFGNSVVGINVNEVPNMRAAIEDYCGEIEKYLANLTPEADASMAFQSEEVHNALKNYMDKVKTYCMNLVSQLRAFSDKLADVKNQWEAAAAAMAGNINNTSGAFEVGNQYSRTIE